MSHIKSTLTVGFILLIIVLRVHAEDSVKDDVGEWRDDRGEMHEIQRQERMEFREDAREQMQEFRQKRATNAAQMRQEFREDMSDATSAAERRMIIKDSLEKRKEFRESSASARRSLWDMIRGTHSDMVDEQKQERSSLFEKLRSIFSFWKSN